MTKNKTFLEDRTDRILVGISLIILLLCISGIYFDGWLYTNYSANTPLIGKVVYRENDVRHKSAGDIEWSRAKSAQKIHLGDALFSGANSLTEVKLDQGSYVDLGANTLVVFRDVDGEKLADLSDGNFRLNFNGDVKIAIHGQVTKLSGHESEVQIFLKEKAAPVVKLLRGTASISQGKRHFELKSNDALTFEPLPEPSVHPFHQSGRRFSYTQTLYDIYDHIGNLHKLRAQLRNYVTLPVPIRWKTEGPVSEIWIEHSMSPQFDQSTAILKSTGQGTTLRYVFTGKNYWRISLDQKHWSSPQEFFVDAHPLPDKPPELSSANSVLYLVGDRAAEIAIRNPPGIHNAVLEYSPSSNFSPTVTRIRWAQSGMYKFDFNKLGTAYFRARGVNDLGQVTAYSNILKIQALAPPPLETPMLTSHDQTAYPGEVVGFSWPRSAHAGRYELTIQQPNGNVIHKELTNHAFRWRVNQMGRYHTNLSVIDQWGRKAEALSLGEVNVIPRSLSSAVAKTKKRNVPERVPASIATTETKFNEIPNYLNRKYDSSEIDMFGAAYTMVSQEELDAGRGMPIGTEMGIHATHWFNDGSNGIEGEFKSKVIGSSEVSPMDFEARYAHRWRLAWNPFPSFDETQIAALFGVEFYDDPGVVYFSPHYTLIKTGFSLNFPVFYHWGTGGEVLYGMGFDQSYRYEVSGHLDYYLSRSWTLGAGYRIHYFQAGSDASAPPGIGTPYREAYDEIFTFFGYHY